LAALRRAGDMYESMADQGGYGSAQGNIGSLHHILGDYETALAFQLKSLAIHESINNKFGITVALLDVGTIYRDLKKLAEAREYLVRAHTLSAEIQSKEFEAKSLCELGLLCEAEATLMDGEMKTAKLKEALELIEKGAAILNEMNNAQKNKYKPDLERVKKIANSE
jgi:tetratricopeptide (TPR) repeat protein